MHNTRGRPSGRLVRLLQESRVEFFGVLIEVADEDGDHLRERSWFAPERHLAVALFVREADEKRDKAVTVEAEFQAKVLDRAAGALIHARLVPGVDVGLGFVVLGVGWECDASADADADELAEIVRGDVGEELAARPCAIARVDDLIPGGLGDAIDRGLDPVAGFGEGEEEGFEDGSFHAWRV